VKYNVSMPENPLLEPSDLYSSNSIQVLHFVMGVCKRPQMYTINGTLEEVGALFWGFYSGICWHSRDKTALEDTNYFWFDFLDYAADHLSVQGKTWTHVFQVLKKLSSNEAVGFAKLIELYDLYLATHQCDSQ
jgi:hypothetical protein